MRTVLLAAITLMCGLMTAPAVRAEGPAVYDLVGTNPGGSGGYKGTVTLEVKGQTAIITWTMSNGDQTIGTGIVNGDTMAAAYPTDGGYGVCLYTRDPATETVTGNWTASGSSALGTERWTLRR
ncbi:MAG: hypothetical protein WCF85_04440 [Rhodospirillaceae bacterium]